ncbi:GAF and ANTAR domain-containing protein [Rhodococcus sp. BP-241]|uniref:GAF and ANTAR domain-containing protein n=1 Tax=Rhodococcus sp. BP-241 TaxID=2739441 RepID=UPI001C9B6683|nr:GAF and ANTAR domain-containing protein [Rhodococcus sp. BP-241]MBY6707859.1 GAF and ANTAR domain-containing protein [Rhodococcus sp. BP-241]
MSNDGRPPSSEHLDLVRTLAELAREFAGSRQVRTIDEVLDHVLAVSVDLIDAADHASVRLAAEVSGPAEPSRTSSDIAAALDRVQRRPGDGPTVDLLHRSSEADVDLADVVAGPVHRWPGLAEVADAVGVRALAAVPLAMHERTLGVLTLYSSSTAAFDEDSLTVATAIAAHAAIAVQSLQKEAQFRSGLASRDIIGQAKGMLMERFEVDSVQAFEMLSKLSQNNNRPLHKLAADIVEAGAKLRYPST